MEPKDYNGSHWVSVTVSVILPEKIAQHAMLFFPSFFTESAMDGPAFIWQTTVHALHQKIWYNQRTIMVDHMDARKKSADDKIRIIS